MVARAGGGVLHYVPTLAFLAVLSAMNAAAIAGVPVDSGVVRHRELMARRLDGLMASLSPPRSPSPKSASPDQHSLSDSLVYHVTAYGADPTGKTDSTRAISRAISDASAAQLGRSMTSGIVDLGGVQVHLDGGRYLISSPLVLPGGVGNIKIHSGTIQASDHFPVDRYLIELWASHSSSNAASSSKYGYEYVTLSDLMLDANFRGGGVAVVDALRTSIDNCYVVHFTLDGILVRSGHETFIRSSFIGQYFTAGGDPREKGFTGTGINLMSNDNAVTDVVIFSAAIGILVSGQANVLTGVHCYNKATRWGGTGIYLKLPGLTQTRIVNCYMDYTSIVSEDPVMLHISGSFFLGDANVVLKSVKGTMTGVEIVDNLFSGSGGGKNIVELDQSSAKFADVDQVYVQRNSVMGMALRTTATTAMMNGNGSVWTVDFSTVLLLPDRIRHVQYSMLIDSSAAFPKHALRSASGNKVVIKSDVVAKASVYVSVDQNMH